MSDLGIAPTGFLDTPAYLLAGETTHAYAPVHEVRMYAVDLSAGVTYRFATSGPSDDNPALALTDRSGAIVGVDDDSGPDRHAQLDYTSEATGRYYVALGSVGAASLNVDLTFTQISDANPVDAVGAAPGQTGQLVVGGSINGLIDYGGDSDWYAIQLTAGQRYQFSLRGIGGTPLPDAFLQVRSGVDGHVLTFNDDSGLSHNSAVGFTPSTSGVYYVAAADWDTETGNYRLSAQAVASQDLLATITSAGPRLDHDIKAYFGVSADLFGPTGGRAWSVEEINAVSSVFDSYSAVANVTFTRVSSAADATLILALSDLAEATQGVALVTSPTHAEIAFDPNALGWTPDGLQPGGEGYGTILHEIGLSLGSSSPHEGGLEMMDGAYQPFGAYGVGGINQDLFTVMSYNRGYVDPTDRVSHASPGPAGPMALDIAALQARYGAGVAQHAGADSYMLGPGAIRTLLDSGGIDSITTPTDYASSIIDLRPASLIAQAGGGGFLSSLMDGSSVIGGFTIAAGVAIENAYGGNGADQIYGNQEKNVLSGGGGADLLCGGAGNDTLDGGSNIDTAVFSGAMSAYTITNTGGAVAVVGPDGSDILTNTEFLQFSDQTFHYRPGAAANIDFNAAPTTYSAALRDFDGNDLGGSGAWVLAGHVDIQGDGDQEYILFNQQIGRWATIGPAADGKVYFDDHGWAGDTRVVGIYVDPEVQQGHAVLGGPNDSQRRFQNDLNIGNLKGVLGGGDYDHDGLQEVYFSLTDGTAYLHAYMHADGNIKYANYQSQAQVTDYLTSNGFAPTTWDGWF